MIFKVAEKFVSINGEGTKAGQPAVFIRLAGCNLRCSYCDTMWANGSDTPFEPMTEDEIAAYIADSGIKNVTLTGGEPLMAENVRVLLERLSHEDIAVEIETNGSADISVCDGISPRPSVTLDYKLPSSGMKDSLLTARECRNWWDALAPIVNAEQPDLIARNDKEPNMLPDTFRCKNDNRPEILAAEDSILPASPDTISYTSWLDNRKGRPMNVARGQALRGKPWISDGIPLDGRSVITEQDFEEIVVPALERHQGGIMVLYADGKITPVEDPTFEKVTQGS